MSHAGPSTGVDARHYADRPIACPVHRDGTGPPYTDDRPGRLPGFIGASAPVPIPSEQEESHVPLLHRLHRPGRAGPTSPTGSTSSATSPAASLRRHVILADLNVLQVATLMGTGLLVTLGVILGGRSYITTVTPDGLIASQPSAHGTSVQDPAAGSIPSTGDSSEKTV